MIPSLGITERLKCCVSMDAVGKRTTRCLTANDGAAPRAFSSVQADEMRHAAKPWSLLFKVNGDRHLKTVGVSRTL